MYPFLNLDYRGIDLVMECNQHDIGCAKRFVTNRDLKGKIVKYVIALGDGHCVTDYCTLIDPHTIEMIVPPQVTASSGTYDGQIIVLSQDQVDSSFETWKSKVLAGMTQVVVEPLEANESVATSESSQLSDLSFVFKIRVFSSVYKNGDYFEGDLTKLITKIQQDNDRISKAYETLKRTIDTNTKDITDLKGKSTTHDSRLDNAFTNLGEIGAKATENASKISALEAEASTLNTRVTGLSQGVANNTTLFMQEIERVEGLISDGEAGALSVWKSQVLAGQTPVLIDDSPVSEANDGGDESGQSASEN
ncbi:hypothetical protein [Dubosiella newyorkensis]|uniref:hypothetical protein n=1 Tax=Dubosiella newyorkensis TaxID=1862672 RepID=UPI00272EC0EA|nr:hypothetical protein [Dubosiella newyorkensis]